MTDSEQLLEIDKAFIWHPYSAMSSTQPIYPVVSAHGVNLQLADGRELIDGMSSWWCAIHGYNHPQLNAAVESQLKEMAHVMFGGLTHPPATQLANLLVDITPAPLQSVFFSDSGSVAVEVAMKMAIQYWFAKGHPQRQRFIALQGAYHGDTMGAMSVCDPITGMHGLFSGILPQQLFVPRPTSRFREPCEAEDIEALRRLLQQHGPEVAALIVEPIVQGAGGMWFYSADYLRQARALCTEYDVLMISDEIATGFGRTGELFACEHAQIVPDIMCVGKAMTGGYLTLAATLTTREIHEVIDEGSPGVFMHGPTFMGNALACSVAVASIKLLLDSDWRSRIHEIESLMQQGLEPCRSFSHVSDVRVLGAIGVVEMQQPVDMRSITEFFVQSGVWVRPFGKLVYLMPPYIIKPEELNYLTGKMVEAVAAQSK